MRDERTIVVLGGDQTGQELLEASLRVLAPDVVGLELDALDDTQTLVEQSQVRMKKFEWVETPVPAGGPDDPSQCPEETPGE